MGKCPNKYSIYSKILYKHTEAVYNQVQGKDHGQGIENRIALCKHNKSQGNGKSPALY